MTLQGYQFDKAKVTPEADAQLYSYLAQTSDNKVISGLTATATGLNVYVSAGKALVQGRLIENSQPMVSILKKDVFNNKRVSAKFTLVNTKNSVRVEFHIRTLAGSIAKNTIVEFEDFKVELGYPTIYTPAPEDYI